MSLNVLWEHMKKIWTKGRGYQLKNIIEKDPEKIVAIFEKDQSRALVYCTNKKVGVTIVRTFLKMADQNNCKEGTIATTDRITRAARQEAVQAGFEVVDSSEPLIYIFDHYLVPQARIISEEEKKKLVEKYGSLKYFPKILVTDPVVRILRAKPGDVIEFVRRVPPLEELIEKYGPEFGRKTYETLKLLIPAGEEKYYRVVATHPYEIPITVEEEIEEEEEKEEIEEEETATEEK